MKQDMNQMYSQETQKDIKKKKKKIPLTIKIITEFIYISIIYIYLKPTHIPFPLHTYSLLNKKKTERGIHPLTLPVTNSNSLNLCEVLRFEA